MFAVAQVQIWSLFPLVAAPFVTSRHYTKDELSLCRVTMRKGKAHLVAEDLQRAGVARALGHGPLRIGGGAVAEDDCCAVRVACGGQALVQGGVW